MMWSDARVSAAAGSRQPTRRASSAAGAAWRPARPERGRPGHAGCGVAFPGGWSAVGVPCKQAVKQGGQVEGRGLGRGARLDQPKGLDLHQGGGGSSTSSVWSVEGLVIASNPRAFPAGASASTSSATAIASTNPGMGRGA